MWEIDPDSRSAVEILAGDGRRIAGVPVALEVGDFLFLGSIGDDRVGVVRRRQVWSLWPPDSMEGNGRTIDFW